MKIGDKVYIKGVVDEIRKDTIIIRNKGGYFGTVEEEIVNRTETDKPIGEWIKGYYFPDGEYWRCKKCGEQIKVNYPMRYCSNCGDRKR